MAENRRLPAGCEQVAAEDLRIRRNAGSKSDSIGAIQIVKSQIAKIESRAIQDAMNGRRQVFGMRQRKRRGSIQEPHTTLIPLARILKWAIGFQRQQTSIRIGKPTDTGMPLTVWRELDLERDPVLGVFGRR